MATVNLASVDLNLLVVFDTIMTERNVSRAAARLHLSQSAVSHALTRLRSLLDDPLFVRTPAGMQPTSLAESISGRVRAALIDIQGVLTPGSGFDPARATQRFVIGMTDYVALVIMPGLAQRLQRAAPGVRIVVLPANARTSVGLLDRGEIDLFVGSPPHDPPNFISAHLAFTDRGVCVARRGHPALSRRLTAKNFLEYAHLHVSPWGEAGYFDEMLSRQRTARRIALTVGHFLLAPAILEQSDLLAILPKRIAEPMAKRYRLGMRDLPFDLGITQIAQAWHRRLDPDPSLRWIRDEIGAIVGTAK